MDVRGDPFAVVRQFEAAVAAYTGAPFCVAVNSCTMALFLALLWVRGSRDPDTFAREQGILLQRAWVTIPFRTYPSVPMVARHAGYHIKWSIQPWSGAYQLFPTAIWDSAKRFTGNMYHRGEFQCVSFHARKLLPIGAGGAILHDSAAADGWLRRMRFDGRAEGVPTDEDQYTLLGWHCYMLPEQAARGLHLLSFYPKEMPDQELDDYPDLRRWTVFTT